MEDVRRRTAASGQLTEPQVWSDRPPTVLAEQVTDTVWGSTFQDVHGHDLDDDVLTLSVPSQLVRQRIEQRYLGLMEAVLD